jgi:hypothetical protein
MAKEMGRPVENERTEENLNWLAPLPRKRCTTR